MTKFSNIYLVGLMGAGKTTVGRRLARRLGWAFYDSDHEIEARTGTRIPVIFDIEGEAGFRLREARMIEELTQLSGIVLSTGGGVILNAENRLRLKENGLVVYLDTPPELLWERTRLDRNRPLLQTPDPLGRLRALYEERHPLYCEVADIVLDAKRYNAYGAVQRLVKEVEEQCGNRH
ncbi:MAG: shikimate kinase [Betaproteobacteria bacterium]|nr:shikimate kinase [Betaproteobacteria bacterium]